MRGFDPYLREEITYRFTAPLPLSVTVRGVRWEFRIEEMNHPPYFSLKLQNTERENHYVVRSFKSREHALKRVTEPITIDYPNTLVSFFRQLRLEGRAELVAGPHTLLFYRDYRLDALACKNWLTYWNPNGDKLDLLGWRV